MLSELENFGEFPVLRNALAIDQSRLSEVGFSLEAVLTPEHSMYHAPEGEEQYCICVGCYGICGSQAGQ
ncbi:hypothetical protein [Nocardia barduliensis]|uniref:hypothetical protein n=1 Tax=Nocardia barduliensis TaxID=2736643 RepID=UPI001572EF3B|nr:hypothetical protein [Nocardia barduliensis]